MERKILDQILSPYELGEEAKKVIINEFLSVHHSELQAEKDRADEATQSLTELQKSYDSAVRSSEDLDALKGEITTLKANNKQALAEIENKYKGKLLDNAIELALTQAGAKNNRAAAALIDKSNLTLQDDGTVFGLSELIDTVKNDETTSFLFNQPQPQQKEMKYNYVPQADVPEVKEESIDSIMPTHHDSNAQILGWSD